MQTLAQEFVEVDPGGEIFPMIAKNLTRLKNVKFTLMNDGNGMPLVNSHNQMLIFQSNPGIEWLVLKGLKLPWDFVGECVQMCNNLRFLCVSYPNDLTAAVAHLLTSQIGAVLDHRPIRADRMLQIYVPNFTDQMVIESGWKELEREDVKLGNDPAPEQLSIDQFIKDEYSGIL